MTDERTGSNSKRIITVAIIALVGLLGVNLFLETEPNDIEVKQSTETSETTSKKPTEKSEGDNQTPRESVNGDDYTYVAKAGDSYTLVARQAIASVAPELSPAKRIAAETKLTQSAGAPMLEVGETVTIEKKQIDQAVTWAENLSQTEEKAWREYAALVEF